MSDFGDLPDDVVALLDTFVESLSGLEVLVMAFREPERGWSADQAAAHLRLPTTAAQRELDLLVRLGLMVHDGGAAPVYLFKPIDPARADAARRIVDCYQARRVGVINHVASRTNKRIQALADAFRLWRKK